jgi:hypothetical protein
MPYRLPQTFLVFAVWERVHDLPLFADHPEPAITNVETGKFPTDLLRLPDGFLPILGGIGRLLCGGEPDRMIPNQRSGHLL